MKKLHLIALYAMIVFGCAKETIPEEPELPTAAQTKSRFLSLDSLQTLAATLPDMMTDGPATRSGEKPLIAEIAPLSDFVRSVATRSSDGIDDAKVTENIYVVNYDNQQGFAILSADTRMETILAYSDQGNITDTMDNPGVHMFMEMLPVYATLRIDPDIWDSLPDEQKYPAQTEIFDRREYSTVGPFIGKCRWTQGTPFNNAIGEEAPAPLQWNCPESSNKKPPLGCVAVAMINIMTANCHPTYYLDNHNLYNLYWSDWKDTTYATDLSAASQFTLAHFGRAVAFSVDMDFGCSGSGSTIEKADGAYRKLFGYNNDGVHNYHIDHVVRDITLGQAVHMSGFATSNWIGYSDGHSWVIDGYKDTYKVNRIYNNGTYIPV